MEENGECIRPLFISSVQFLSFHSKTTTNIPGILREYRLEGMKFLSLILLYVKWQQSRTRSYYLYMVQRVGRAYQIRP